MSPSRSGMSVTLPRNFAPMGLDGLDKPRTPNQTFTEIKLPPPPHHTTMRIRRSRIDLGNFTARNNALPALFASDIPIPSVEVLGQAELPGPAWQQMMTEPSPTDRLCLPGYREQRPKTPTALTKSSDTEPKASAWALPRPNSSCSMRSDSSLSSNDSFISRPSFGGSCTSPESDLQDPFMPRAHNFDAGTPSKSNKRTKVHTFDFALSLKPTWNIEMDNHLWNVYQMYLADPTITPFKTVPGSIPPLGVCNRVARRARATWPKATRVPQVIVHGHTLRDVMDDAHAVRDTTPKLADFDDGPRDLLRDSSSEEARPPWPKESATRRRLKELCKSKFSITPHYQRLRVSRSPSPFTDQFARRPSSRSSRHASETHDTSASYATRDLGISLVASGATVPLAQLCAGGSPLLQQDSDDWFNTPVIPSSAQSKASSFGLGIDSDRLAPSSSIPRLASPFNYNTWDGPGHSRRKTRPELPRFDTIHTSGARLLSPVQLDPFSNAHKRRAQQQLGDELSLSGSIQPPQRQELVFTGVGDISHGRIRLRNRGATIGAADSQERLHRLFSPPPIHRQPGSPFEGPSFGSSSSSSSFLAPPETEDHLKRLGSPFELVPNRRSNRAKSPRHIPSLSDPFISTPYSNPNQRGHQSIAERLQAFAAMQNHQSPSLL